jgi:hypothetical protein
LQLHDELSERAALAGTNVANDAMGRLTHLTQAELDFVYNVEVLDLPPKKAADLAGFPRREMFRPHIMEAREVFKNAVRGSLNITKHDVLHGITEAINRAKIIAEPSTEIAGWKQISTMLGYDAPTVHRVDIRESVTVVQQHVRRLPDSELVDMLGAGGVIDVEFYPQLNKPDPCESDDGKP